MAKVCPICEREFANSSVRCPICKCDLADASIQKGRATESRHQNQPKAQSGNQVRPEQQQRQNMTNIPQNNSHAKRVSALSIIALVLSFLGCFCVIGIVLAIIDLGKKDGKKKVCSIIALAVSCIWPIASLAETRNGLENNRKENIGSSSEITNDIEERADTLESETNGISKLTFLDENILDVTINDMKKYDYIKDVYIEVKESENRINIVVQVPAAVREDVAKMAGEDVARYLAFMASCADHDYAMPSSDDIGGIYELYDLLIYIDDGNKTFDIYGAKVTSSNKITW